MPARTVARAMAEALYGPEGVYQRRTPRSLFSTSVTASPLLAAAVLELAHRVARVVGDDGFALVDVGAGDGALLAALAGPAPPAWRLVALDVRARPDGLPARVRWDPPPAAWWTADVEQPAGPPMAGVRGLVVAHELLDDVPVGVHVRAAGGWRERREDGSVAGPSEPRSATWLQRWCAGARPGDEAESGERRDALWSALVGALAVGAVLAVDYAVPPGAAGGTLRAYAGGRLVPIAFDGSCQVTAGVRTDALAAAGLVAGAESTVELSQRDALPRLGVRPPARLGSAADLALASAVAGLRDPDGLGSHRWLLQARGVDAARLLA